MGDSATFDETAHLPAGLSYWDRGDFRLNPEHPPLAKLWAALPAKLLGLGEASYARQGWIGRPLPSRETVPGSTALRTTGASEWSFGFEALNGAIGSTPRADPRPFLRSGRLMMLLLTLGLGLLLYRAALKVWTPTPALAVLALFSFSPTFLAHGHLVTTDVPLAAGFLASLLALASWIDKPTLGRAGLLALALTGSVLFKFSGLFLGLPVGCLTILALLNERRSPALRARLLQIPLILGLMFFGIWAGYGFRFAAADPAYQLHWGVIGGGVSATSIESNPDIPKLVTQLHGARALPEPFLYGIAYTSGGASRRLAYLDGELSSVGWRSYFPLAFLYKTPLPILLLTLLGVIPLWGWLRRKRPKPADSAQNMGAARFFGLSPLVLGVSLTLVSYAAISTFAALNIGHRHLIPCFPLLFLLMGKLFSEPGWVCRSARLLLLLLPLSTLSIAPNYLGYFNTIAGGIDGGPEHLLDSNLDWGQDLGRLATRLEQLGVERVALAYFGTADPAAYGIEFDKLLWVHDYAPNSPTLSHVRVPATQWVAVSANLLHGLYLDTDRNAANGILLRGWASRDALSAWIQLRDRLTREGIDPPSLLEWAESMGIISPAQRKEVEDSLLDRWLASLDEKREKIRVGASVYLFAPEGESTAR